MPGAERRVSSTAEDGEARLDVSSGPFERIPGLTVEERVQLHALMAHAVLRDERAGAGIACLERPASALNPVLHLHGSGVQRLGSLAGGEPMHLLEQQRRCLVWCEIPQRAGEADREVFLRNGLLLGRPPERP